MKKFYKIILLLIALIFLSTFKPREFKSLAKKTKPLIKIENIEIKKNFPINKIQIKKKFDAIYKENIFFIKREDIEKPLKNIDFLEKIEVKKKYPDTIILKIYETKPVAIFFKKNQKYVLDSSSNLITFSEKIFFKNRVFYDFFKKNKTTFLKNFQITKN